MKKNLKYLAFAILGGILGFAYYYFIGCKSGSCTIQSNPLTMTLFGTVCTITSRLSARSSMHSLPPAKAKLWLVEVISFWLLILSGSISFKKNKTRILGFVLF